jgi:hypothetical protein
MLGSILAVVNHECQGDEADCKSLQLLLIHRYTDFS